MILPPSSESGENRPDVNSDEIAGIGGSRARRRDVMLGGISAAGVLMTLASRPALAGTNKCSISAMGSANPSHVISSKCGDTASCWSTTNSNCWADGATCNGVPVQYTHSTNLCSVLTILGNSPFYCQNTSMINTISGNGGCRIKMKNGQWVSIWSSSQQCNVSAAILNDLFYGSRYYSTPIQNVINTFLNNCVSYANQSQSSNITSAASTLDNTLSLLNQQGQ